MTQTLRFESEFLMNRRCDVEKVGMVTIELTGRTVFSFAVLLLLREFNKKFLQWVGRLCGLLLGELQ